MKKLITAAVLGMFLLGSVSEALALVNVRGYYRSNGTYVAPHVRTNPDGVKWNNLSYRGW